MVLQGQVIRFVNWGGRVLLGVTALFLFLSPSVALADTSSTPSGWTVLIEGWTHQANYVEFTVLLPTGATGVHVYDYKALTDSVSYSDFAHTNLGLDSNGYAHFFVYDMLGGGYPTFFKMTPIWADGTESPQPSNEFVLQLDVSVWIDGISASVLAKLQGAIGNLQDATGVGQATSAGTALKNSLGGIGSFSTAGGGDLAVTIPISIDHSVNGVDMPAVTVTLFTTEQLAKLPWLKTLQDILRATMWVGFVVFLVQRFAPIFKV